MTFKHDLVAAQLEKVHRLRAAFQCELAPSREQHGWVQVNTAHALQETQALNEQLVAVEAVNVADEVKFAQMEASFKNLQQRLVRAQTFAYAGSKTGNPACCLVALVSFHGNINVLSQGRCHEISDGQVRGAVRACGCHRRR